MLKVTVDVESGTSIRMILVKPARLNFSHCVAISFPSGSLPHINDAGNPKLYLSLTDAEYMIMIL